MGQLTARGWMLFLGARHSPPHPRQSQGLPLPPPLVAEVLRDITGCFSHPTAARLQEVESLKRLQALRRGRFTRKRDFSEPQTKPCLDRINPPGQALNLLGSA